MTDGMAMPGGWTMSMAWMRMPDRSWPATAAMFVAMWLVMMIAMMLPSFAPVIVRHRRPLRIACAYFAVWLVAGVAVYPLGVALAAAAMHWRSVALAVPFAAGAAIVLAGLVQLTRWKANALYHCRERACCAIGRKPGPRQAWRDGLWLGTNCVRCCCPAMLVLLVAGVMDLVAMAVVAAVLTIERVGPVPRVVRRVLGGLAIVIGGLVIARQAIA